MSKVLTLEYKMENIDKKCLHMLKYSKCEFTNKRCDCKTEYDYNKKVYIVSCEKLEY